jgi:glyoxylase-like metal-dependent hydrolase (beta-lactamase superfamily II)
MTTKTIGDFSVTAVSDGVLNSNHDVILGVERAESERMTGIPYGQPLPLDVNCFVIRYRDHIMLSDAGTGHSYGPTLGKLPQNLRAAGIAPENVDTILLTHLHPDHSFGLVDPQGRPIFPNAHLIVHEVEAAFWLDREPRPDDSERIARNTKAQRTTLAPYAGRIRRVRDGEVLPGIAAIMRPGHTPGHTTWLLQSGNERLLLWGDIVHLAAVQVPRPDAALIFDVDPELAKASRQAAFDWVSRERVSVGGAHLGFPGFGKLERAGPGFVFRPEAAK